MIHAEFSSKYIASLDGTIPIPSAQASQLFSGGSIVYVDELIVSELFEYIATYYLFEVPDRAVKTVLFVLFILYKLVDIGTIELNEAHAAALIKCAELHASERPVREEDLLQASNVTNTVLTELEKLGCVELVDGNVRLIESIHIH